MSKVGCGVTSVEETEYASCQIADSRYGRLSCAAAGQLSGQVTPSAWLLLHTMKPLQKLLVCLSALTATHIAWSLVTKYVYNKSAYAPACKTGGGGGK